MQKQHTHTCPGVRRAAIRLLTGTLLAGTVLAGCRQQPTPQPLPDPMTPKSSETLAGSAFH